MGEGLESIGFEAFYDCDVLAEIIIPNNVTTIGTYAFDNCDGMVNAVIGDSVQSLENYAFYGCANLSSVTIGKSVGALRERTLAACPSLSSIAYTSTVEDWKNISKYGEGTSTWDWNGDTPDYTVYCTDGTVTKSGTVTYY